MKSISKPILLALLGLSLHGCAGMPEYTSVSRGPAPSQNDECCTNPLEGRRSSDTSARGIR